MNSQQSLDAEKTKANSPPWARKHVPLALIPISAFIGLQSYLGVASNPRFESIHKLDVIRLMTAGAAFAITLMPLIMFVRFSKGKSKS